MNLRVILHNEFTSRWVCNGGPISWKEFSKQGNEATDNVPSGRRRDWLRLLLSLFTNLPIGELVNRKCALARFIFLVTRAVACLVVRSEGAHPLLGPWKWDNISFWYLLCQQALVQSLLLPGLIPKRKRSTILLCKAFCSLVFTSSNSFSPSLLQLVIGDKQLVVVGSLTSSSFSLRWPRPCIRPLASIFSCM